MRSRYSAYVLGLGDYLVQTNTRAPREAEAAELSAWGKAVGWAGLEVRSKEHGSASDSAGIVHFVARFVEGGSLVSLEERSQFSRVDGRWWYVEGQATSSRVKLGRNDPCPCQSGRKVKQCHS